MNLGLRVLSSQPSYCELDAKVSHSLRGKIVLPGLSKIQASASVTGFCVLSVNLHPHTLQHLPTSLPFPSKIKPWPP
jgi:hypothetical protein